MARIWKRLEVLVTGLKPDVFQAARLKLTFFYTAVLLSVVLVFSTLIYVALAREIRENIKDTIAEDTIEEAVIGNTIESARARIMTIDASIIIFASFLSYFLAGKTLRPIREALDRERQFTADASHELRTPLTILRTGAEVALKNEDLSAKELRGVLIDLVKETDEITSVVTGLLQTAREHSKNSFSRIDLSSILTGVILKFKTLAETKNILLTSKVENGIWISGNEDEIKRAFMNIVENALKYTESGGVIEVSATRQKGMVEVVVKDNGVGISAKDLPHIFERFYKADRSRSNSGAGLGLAIVSQIINKHRGKISVSSDEHSGTVVNVMLITS